MLARGIFWTVLGQGSQTVAGIVTAGLINRVISPVGRGVVADIQTWAALFVALFGISLSTAIYHFANRERYSIADNARVHVVVLTSAGTALLATIAMSAILFFWPGTVSPQAMSSWPVLVTLPAATIFATNLQTLAFALGQIRLASAVSIFVALASLLIVVPAYLIDIIDLPFALAVTLATQLVGAVVMFLAIWRRVGWSSQGIPAGTLRGFMATGLKQHLATISTFAYTRVNQLIVFHFCGDSETGLLAAAYTLAFGVFALVVAVQSALYATVIRSEGGGFDVTISIVRIGLWGGLLVVAPSVGFSDKLLLAYGGAGFLAAVPCFRMLVMAAWLLSVSSLTAPYYVKAGAFWLASGISVVLGLESVVANLLLVPRFAANGAAAATLLTVATGFVAVLGMLRIISGASPLAALVPDFRAEFGMAYAWLSRRRRVTP